MSTPEQGAPERPIAVARDRVDGRLEVTGQALYVADFAPPDLLHGFVVSSSVARGRILAIDSRAALALQGVQAVFTHDKRPHLPWFDRSYRDDDARAGSPFRPLYDARIRYSGQPIALVVADSFERARQAASLIRVEILREPHETDLRAQRDEAYEPSGVERPRSRGDAEAALTHSALRMHAEYATPVAHHNPLECHASTVIYDDGALTIYDKTQGTQNSQAYVCRVFRLARDKVRVLSPFVGGAFGSGLRPQYQLVLAVMAARELKRSVRVELTRPQMFTFGHRPETIQRITLGARGDGTLSAIVHEAVAETSRFEDYAERVVDWSGMLYQCDNVKLEYEVAQLDNYTPLDMRAPGAALGVYALEVALDELSHLAGIDPLALRIQNYTEHDPAKNRPFSSKALRACYLEGAARFGWERRIFAPRSMRDGHQLVGLGMATGVWEALQQPAQFTCAAHSAVFAEVKVDEALGTIRVTRVVSAIAGGRILNPKTARSQIVGGVVWGIGMALSEESLMDTKLGRFMNRNLADYHIPVHADVPEIEVLFVAEPDEVVNPLGVEGLGEIGLVGVAAAIANAVFHATGKRIRDLPITLDQLL